MMPRNALLSCTHPRRADLARDAGVRARVHVIVCMVGGKRLYEYNTGTNKFIPGEVQL